MWVERLVRTMARMTPSRSSAAADPACLVRDLVAWAGRFGGPAVPEQVDSDDAMGSGQHRNQRVHERVEEADSWMSRSAGRREGRPGTRGCHRRRVLDIDVPDTMDSTRSATSLLTAEHGTDEGEEKCRGPRRILEHG